MSEALAVGRIVRYKLTERETITKEPDQTADLGVFLNGRVDLPSVVHWEPEAKRIPLILAPLAWVGAVAQDMVNGEPASGMFGFPRREN
jgi:hypothetical protein